MSKSAVSLRVYTKPSTGPNVSTSQCRHHLQSPTVPSGPSSLILNMSKVDDIFALFLPSIGVFRDMRLLPPVYDNRNNTPSQILPASLH